MRLGSRPVRVRPRTAHGAAGEAAGADATTGAKGDALRELCHDLRQPLAAITACVEAAKTDPNLSPGAARWLQEILEESLRASEMVRHVLDDTLAFEPIDAGKAIAEVVDWARITYKGRLDFSAEMNDLLVVADRVLLRRGFSNLLDNATRAAGPGGTVTVAVIRRDGWIQVDVSDSGEGQGPPQGTGLGLRIVERLTRTHGGDLALLRAPLGGVLVRLRLPAASRERAKVKV